MKNTTLATGFGDARIKDLETLNPVRSYYQVLGTLAKFPQLLLHPRMDLREDDFFQEFHKVVFISIRNMVYKDNKLKTITYVDIDDHLSQNSELYEIWKRYDGMDYMRNAIKHSNSDAFKLHYRTLRKYTLMRQFVNAGVDVTGLFKYYESDLHLYTQSRKQFELLELDEVENQLIEAGKGNVELQQQLSYKMDEIDNQIAMLMKQKQGLNDLKEKLT